MKEYKTFQATIKERGNDHLLTPTFSGYVDRQYMIQFWGLNEPDVEWYKLEDITNKTNN